MKIIFQLTNKEFDDALAVSVNGETKELTEQDNEINFEISDNEEIAVQVQYVRSCMQNINNPIGRFLVYFLLFLLSIIVFFTDNDNGIGIHKFFYGAKPFELKKVFKIKSVNNVVSLKYISPMYNNKTKSFSVPNVEIVGAETTGETVSTEYNSVAMKKEFRYYHYPAYTVLFAVIIALNILMAICLFGQFAPFDLIGVIGMSLCCLVTLALLIIFICVFVSTHRLLNQIELSLLKNKVTI